MVNIQSELSNNPILLSVFSSEFYNQSILHLLKNLKNEKICYVTLNKTSQSLMKNFGLNGINTENLFFIDAITASVDKDKKADNVINVSSPYAFTELSIATNEVLKSNMFDLLIFDSLSTLNVYNENTAIRFTSDLMTKIRSKDDRGVFTCLGSDLKTNLIKQSSMHADKVVNFENLYIKLRKQKMQKVGGSLTFVVGLLAVLFFLNTGENNITGLVTSPVSGEVSIIPLLFLIVVVTSVLVAFYKKDILMKVHDMSDVNEPMKITNKSKLRAKFRNRIYKWLNHSK